MQEKANNNCEKDYTPEMKYKKNYNMSLDQNKMKLIGGKEAINISTEGTFIEQVRNFTYLVLVLFVLVVESN